MTPESQIKQYTIPEFASRIRSKYPEYQALSDDDLTMRVLRKHPEYKSRVNLGTAAEAEAQVSRAKAQFEQATSAYTSVAGRTLNPPAGAPTNYFRPLTTAEKEAQKRGEPVIISQAVQEPPLAPELTSRARTVTPAPISLDPVIQGRLEQIKREKRQAEVQQKVERARQVIQGKRRPSIVDALQQVANQANQITGEVTRQARAIPTLQDYAPPVERQPTFAEDRAARAQARQKPQSIGELRRSDEEKLRQQAQIKNQIRAQVLKEQAEREATATSGSEAQLMAQRARQAGLNPPDIEGEVEERYQQYLRSQTPEMTAARQQFGAYPAGERAVLAPTQRFGAGVIKQLGGVAGLAGLTPNDLSRFLDTQAQFLEESASLPPLNEAGQEIERGLPEKALSAITDLGYTVAELAILKRATGMPIGRIMAIQSALETTDKPVTERVAAATQAYAMGSILDQHLSRPASALLFGAPSGLQNLEEYKQGRMTGADVLLQTGIQAGAGFILGGKGAKAIPKETVDYTLKSPLTPEPVKDVVANVVQYGKGMIRSEDGRAMSLYSDPNTGEVFGSEITSEQAKNYDPTIVTGEKRPVRNAKEVSPDEYDVLARALGVETKTPPKGLPGEVERAEPVVEKPVSSTAPVVESKEVKPESRPKEAISSSPPSEQVSAPDQTPETRAEKPSKSEPISEKAPEIALDQIAEERTSKVPAKEPTVTPPAELKTQPSATESQLTTGKEAKDVTQEAAVVPSQSGTLPSKVAVFRGSTSTEKESRSGATFFSPSREYASQYGPNVQEATLDTSNFFDTRKPEHRKILEDINNERRGDYAVASVHPTDGVPFYSDESALRDALRDRGYKFDGIVLTDWTPRGSGGIVYAKYKQPAAEKSPIKKGGKTGNDKLEATPVQSVSPKEAAKEPLRLNEKIADFSPSNEEAKRAIPAKLTDWGARLKTIAESKNLDDLQALSDEMRAHQDEPRVARLRTSIQEKLAKARQRSIYTSAASAEEAENLSKTETSALGLYTKKPSKAAAKTLEQAETPEGKTVRPAPTHRIGAPKTDSSRNSVEQQVRSYGGIKDDASQAYKGELGWLKESGKRGTVNQSGGLSVEEMATRLAQDGYGKGIWWEGAANNVDPQAFLQAVMDDTRGQKHYSTERDEIEDDPDVTAWDALTESETGKELIERVQSGHARAADIVQFVREASAHGLSDNAIDAFVASLQRTVQEELSGGTEEGEGYQVDEDGTLLDPDGTPLFAREFQLGLPAEGLTQQTVQPKTDDQRERLRREHQERNEAANPQLAAARRELEEIRRRGMTVDEYSRQGSMFEAAPSAEEIGILRELERAEKLSKSGESDSEQASMFAKGEAGEGSGDVVVVEGNRIKVSGRSAQAFSDAVVKLRPGRPVTGAYMPRVFARKLAAELESSEPELSTALREAAQKHPFVRVESAPAERHEGLHQQSHELSGYKELDERLTLEGFRSVTSDAPEWDQIEQGLLDLGYQTTLPGMVEEAFANLADGKHELLGITLEESRNWLQRWFQAYAEANGTETPKQFKEMFYAAQDAAEAAHFDASRQGAESQQRNEDVPGMGERSSKRDREPPQGTGEDESSLARSPDITQTEAFKRWFGESKVVNKKGEPLVVYHRSPFKFEAFDPNKIHHFGFHFGTRRQAQQVNLGGERGRMYDAYLSIQNPLRLPDLGTWHHDAIVQELKKLNLITEDQADTVYEAWDPSKELREILKDKGYDGVIYENDAERVLVDKKRDIYADSYIAFDPPQIKSATKNVGTFDPNDPNILMARSDDPWADLSDLADEFERIAKEPEPGAKETKQSKLAAGVEAKAIEAKLTAGFQGLPEYETVKVADQARTAADLLRNDPQEARRVAMGQSLPSGNLLPESVFVAVENDALQRGDVELLRELATVSTLSAEATGMGQRIRMLAERNPYSPVTAMKEIQSAREKRAKKKLGSNWQKEKAKLEARIAELVAGQKIESEIKRTRPRTKSKETKDALDAEWSDLQKQFAELRSGKGMGAFFQSESGELDPEAVSLIGRMARNRIRSGVRNAEDLVNEIFSAVKDHVETSEREVRDAISGYSIAPKSTRSELQKQIDALKSELQALSKEEDIETGTRSPHLEGPKRSEAQRLPMEGPRKSEERSSGIPKQGPKLGDIRRVPALGPRMSEASRSGQPLQGPKLSDVRKLPAEGPRLSESTERKPGPRMTDAPLQGPKQSDVNRLKAEGPQMVEHGPPKDLFTKNETRRRQIEREIADLEEQIRKGGIQAKPPKGTPQYTEETKHLQKRLDALRTAAAVSEISTAEATTIINLAKSVESTKVDFENGGDRLAYGLAMVNLRNYVGDLKAKAERLTLGDFKSQPVRSTGKLVWTALQTSKALKAAWDASAVFRPGVKVLLTHPVIWKNNAWKMFQGVWETYKNEEVLDTLYADLLTRPNALNGFYKTSGLDIGVTEEAYPTDVPERVTEYVGKKIEQTGVPIVSKAIGRAVGKTYKASQDAYTAFNNRSRADLFDKYIDIARHTGVELDADTLPPIGRMVNSLVGRGRLGPLEPVAQYVNVPFFSPKMLKSHIDVLFEPLSGGGGGFTGAEGGTKFVRKQAAINLLKIIGGTAAVLGLAAFFKRDSVEPDPRSANFGKIRVGDTRFDITGGWASMAILASRLATFKTKSSITGEVKEINERDKEGKIKFGAQTGKDVVYDFFENKESPPFAVARDVLQGETRAEEKPTVWTSLRDLYEPLPLSNIRELKKNPNSAPLLLAMIADGLGIATNTYGVKPGAVAISNKTVRDELNRLKIDIHGAGTKNAELDTAINAKIGERIDKLEIPQGSTDIGKEKIIEDRIGQIRAVAKAEVALQDPNRYREFLESRESNESLSFLKDEEKKTLTEDDLKAYRQSYAENYLKTLQRVAQTENYQQADDDKKEKILARVGQAAHTLAKVGMVKLKRKGKP